MEINKRVSFYNKINISEHGLKFISRKRVCYLSLIWKGIQDVFDTLFGIIVFPFHSSNVLCSSRNSTWGFYNEIINLVLKQHWIFYPPLQWLPFPIRNLHCRESWTCTKKSRLSWHSRAMNMPTASHSREQWGPSWLQLGSSFCSNGST